MQLREAVSFDLVEAWSHVFAPEEVWRGITSPGVIVPAGVLPHGAGPAGLSQGRALRVFVREGRSVQEERDLRGVAAQGGGAPNHLRPALRTDAAEIQVWFTCSQNCLCPTHRSSLLSVHISLLLAPDSAVHFLPASFPQTFAQ